MDQPDQSNREPENAVDASKARRPGNPMERRPPAPLANAHWTQPDRQQAQPGLLVEPSRGKLTATFGTQHPPAGISGALRRAAYELPDYRARRWAMLILADRVDALESKLIRLAKHPLTWLATAAAASVLLTVRPRRRRRFAF